MYRKIQKVGGKTFSINLPKEWIKSNNIKRGTNIKISEQSDGSLLLNPEGDTTDKKENNILILTDNEKIKNISREITKAYLLGFEQILIKNENAKGFLRKNLQEIEEIIKNYPGTEIMSEGKNEVLIEVIASFENDPKKIIHRMFNLTEDMLDGILIVLDPQKPRGEDLSLEINRIKGIDDKVNRAYFLIVRQLRAFIQDSSLRNKLNIDNLIIMDYRLISHLLESIGDMIKDILELIESNKNKLEPLIEKTYDLKKDNDFVLSHLINTSRRVKEFHKSTFDSFIQNDEVKAEETIGDAEEFRITSNIQRFIIELKHTRMGLATIMYRFYDIISYIVDICDLIQSED